MTTAAPGEQELSAPILDRYRLLTRRASSIRTRRRGDRPTPLVVAGGVMLSLGFVLVLLGYQGASHTIYVFEQIPFLISGGILGGCLVMAGGFTYFAFWLTRLHTELQASRVTEERAAASLERVELLLAQLVDNSTTSARKKAS